MDSTKLIPLLAILVTIFAFGVVYARDAAPASAPQSWGQLPDPQRKLLQDAAKTSHTQNAALRQNAETLENEMNQILAAPEFDETHYLDDSAKLNAIYAKMHANMTQNFIAAVKQMTPGERKMLAKIHAMRHHNHSENDSKGPSYQPEDQ